MSDEDEARLHLSSVSFPQPVGRSEEENAAWLATPDSESIPPASQNFNDVPKQPSIMGSRQTFPQAPALQTILTQKRRYSHDASSVVGSVSSSLSYGSTPTRDHSSVSGFTLPNEYVDHLSLPPSQPLRHSVSFQDDDVSHNFINQTQQLHGQSTGVVSPLIPLRNNVTFCDGIMSSRHSTSGNTTMSDENEARLLLSSISSPLGRSDKENNAWVATPGSIPTASQNFHDVPKHPSFMGSWQTLPQVPPDQSPLTEKSRYSRDASSVVGSVSSSSLTYISTPTRNHSSMSGFTYPNEYVDHLSLSPSQPPSHSVSFQGDDVSHNFINQTQKRRGHSTGVVSPRILRKNAFCDGITSSRHSISDTVQSFDERSWISRQRTHSSSSSVLNNDIASFAHTFEDETSHRSDNRNSFHDTARRPLYDLLTVFQAGPLVYKEKSTGLTEALSTLDFDFERQVLTKTIHEACSLNGTTRIDVDFQIATTDRLSFFLAREAGQIMHFSCHGHPEYLALEDGRGGMDMLGTNQLKKWIDLGGKNLHFVFVSACYSSFIGQAFVDAGVKHVVCCRHDSALREFAAVEFEKIFYRNLACGTKNLQQAFDIAKQEILLCHRIPPEHRAAEAAKFCLLPDSVSHDVPVFFYRANGTPPTPKKTPHVFPVMFPPPPQLFFGRQIEQYLLIQHILRCNLVRVNGPRGVGKSDLVKNCCQYLHERKHLNDLDEIFWFTYMDTEKRSSEQQQKALPFHQVYEVFDIIRNAEIETTTFFARTIRVVRSLVSDLSSTKVLMILEAKELSQQSFADKMALFLQMLIERAPRIKILLIHRLDVNVKCERLSCREQEYTVSLLNVEHSVDLFLELLPNDLIQRKRHGIGSPDELFDLLLSSSIDLSTKRMQDIYDLIGSGNPLQIYQAAKTMTTETLDRLIALGRHNSSETEIRFTSRAALATKQCSIRDQIEAADAQRNYSKCHELQMIFDELENQKSNLPDIYSLQKDFEETAYQLDIAASMKDWTRALRLQGELDRLEASIQIEKDVELATNNENLESETLRTRVSLDAKIRQLEVDYDKAIDEGKFESANQIEDELKRLESFRPHKPTATELLSETRHLQGELGRAKQRRSTKNAKRIYERLVNVRAQLAAEEEAEVAIGTLVDNSGIDGEAGVDGRSTSTVLHSNQPSTMGEPSEFQPGAVAVDGPGLQNPFSRSGSNNMLVRDSTGTRNRRSGGADGTARRREESKLQESREPVCTELRDKRSQSQIIRNKSLSSNSDCGPLTVPAEYEEACDLSSFETGTCEFPLNATVVSNLPDAPAMQNETRISELPQATILSSQLHVSNDSNQFHVTQQEAIEQIVLETIMRNTVEAEVVHAETERKSMGPNSHSHSERKRFGFGNLLKVWNCCFSAKSVQDSDPPVRPVNDAQQHATQTHLPSESTHGLDASDTTHDTSTPQKKKPRKRKISNKTLIKKERDSTQDSAIENAHTIKQKPRKKKKSKKKKKKSPQNTNVAPISLEKEEEQSVLLLDNEPYYDSYPQCHNHMKLIQVDQPPRINTEDLNNGKNDPSVASSPFGEDKESDPHC